MAEQINNLLIYSSNASKKGSQKASVTVRDLSGEVVARIYSERSQPLRWLRKWPHCIERAELSGQLKQAGISQADIDAIVSTKEK
jgi:hypothetical protein